MKPQFRTCRISGPDGKSFIAGEGQSLTVIAGPCVIEDRDVMFAIARSMRAACAEAGSTYVFKASFDKANRTSGRSPRGPGLERGLALLAEMRESLGVAVTTDVHSPEQASRVAEVVDVLQIPAFLCRQTDLLLAVGSAAARFGRAVNVKKGQFLSPEEMSGPVGKIVAAGCRQVMMTERGTFFGYHRLVNDFIGVGDLMAMQFEQDVRPAMCFDCTHSAQLPGAQGHATGGRRDRVPLLARAAVAAGVDAVFMECHPEPERALSDSSTMLRLSDAVELVGLLSRVRGAVARVPGE